MAGGDVTAALAAHLRRKGHLFTTPSDLEAVRGIKEHACTVDTDGSSAGAIEYTLPDGHSISLGDERFQCAETLFNPALMGCERPGIHLAAHGAVMKCEAELRPHLLKEIILAGGTTAMKGFGQRLLNEMRKLSPPSTPIKIWAPANRKIMPWVGGSILASLSTSKTLFITKDAWDEHGERILHSMPM